VKDSQKRKGNKLKRFLSISLSCVLFFAGAPVSASPLVVTKKFSNCTELNKVYPGGVAKSRSVKNKGGVTKNTPTVSAALYAENKTKDRDGDGIACEK
jgi:hypothetical protein